MIGQSATVIARLVSKGTKIVVASYVLMTCGAWSAETQPLAITDEQIALWKQGAIISEETVLFRIDEKGRKYALLLFSPNKLLSVAAVNGEASFPVSDFEIEGRMIIARSDVPSVSDEELFLGADKGLPIAAHIDKSHFLKYGEGDTFHRLQLNVTYETNDGWSGPTPASCANLLPVFTARLRNKDEIKIVVLGDSISAGANASGPIQCAPFKPAYYQMVADELEKRTGAKINLINLSKGGETSFWGETQTAEVLARQPNLVLIAFGMNDASSNMIADEFASNLRRMVLDIRKSSPETEIVIISGMSPNPLWVAAKMDKRAPFHEAAKKIADKLKVPFCDVFSLWNYLEERKGFLSMTGNGVNHPNDYGHRLYRDVLMETLLDSQNLKAIK